MLSDKTIEYSKKLAPLILAIDSLYAAETGEISALVVIRLKTRDAIDPAPLSSYEQAYQALLILKEEAAGLPELDRQVYYGQMCQSLIAFVTWRMSLSFADQLKGFLHVPAQPASDSELMTYDQNA